jgi:hypothetical protein
VPTGETEGDDDFHVSAGGAPHRESNVSSLHFKGTGERETQTIKCPSNTNYPTEIQCGVRDYTVASRYAPTWDLEDPTQFLTEEMISTLPLLQKRRIRETTLNHILAWVNVFCVLELEKLRRRLIGEPFLNDLIVFGRCSSFLVL